MEAQGKHYIMRFKVIEKKFLKRIFELKWDENGEWRRLNSEQHHSLYNSPNTFRMKESKVLLWV